MIGASGSGKSTFARLLLGLEPPTAGRIFVEGVGVTSSRNDSLTDVRKRFAMVVESAALLDSLAVYENVAFPLRERRELDEGEIEQRVIAALRDLDVDRA